MLAVLASPGSDEFDISDSSSAAGKQMAVKEALQALGCNVDPVSMASMICPVAEEGTWVMQVPCGFDIGTCMNNSWPSLAGSMGMIDKQQCTNDAHPASAEFLWAQPQPNSVEDNYVTVKPDANPHNKLLMLEDLYDGTWQPLGSENLELDPITLWVIAAQNEYIEMGCAGDPTIPACEDSTYSQFVTAQNTLVPGGGEE